jgi:hypothetical protein
MQFYFSKKLSLIKIKPGNVAQATEHLPSKHESKKKKKNQASKT